MRWSDWVVLQRFATHVIACVCFNKQGKPIWQIQCFRHLARYKIFLSDFNQSVCLYDDSFLNLSDTQRAPLLPRQLRISHLPLFVGWVLQVMTMQAYMCTGNYTKRWAMVKEANGEDYLCRHHSWSTVECRKTGVCELVTRSLNACLHLFFLSSHVCYSSRRTEKSSQSAGILRHHLAFVKQT